jgi:hypothetical protein
MSEFTPINSQEEFDKAISERLRREREKYDGWVSPDQIKSGYMAIDAVNQLKSDYEKKIEELNGSADESAKKYADFDQQLAERDAKIKSFETASIKTRVAFELGLPYGSADFLKGEDEETIKQSAVALKKLQTPMNAPVAPTFKDSASNDTDGVTAAFKKMNPNLKF